jgi:hypothetical protein
MQPLVENQELRVAVPGPIDSFTWDERGRLWTARKNELRLHTGDHRVFRTRVSRPAALLVHGTRAFVAEGSRLRELDIGRELREVAAAEIPARRSITGAAWGSLGHIFVTFEGGLARLDPAAKTWETIALGLAAEDVTFDDFGLPVLADDGLVLRVAPGLNYSAGLENYTKRDLGLVANQPRLSASAVVVADGVWTVFDSETRQLQQFKEQPVGTLAKWRDLADLSGVERISGLKFGPDGALWMLADSKLLRLASPSSSACPADLTPLSSGELAALLYHRNPWQRQTALRLLESREDLRQARGLHPSTPLHTLLQDQQAAPIGRANALRALHRLNLADDTAIEDAALLGPPELRAAAIELVGERGYTTGTAFKALEKNANHTNHFVRTAVLIAARRFVSGSIVNDTPPRFPIREVFTGGVLSGLWFSAENGSTPEFDLLFWNAVRPITAFDAAHAIGFFQEEGEPFAFAFWLLPRIARQVAAMDDPLRQQDALMMMRNIKPSNHRLLIRMLEAMNTVKPNARPEPRTLETLELFASSQNVELSRAASVLLTQWR